MEKRQQKILKAVISEYNKTAQPVSSQVLCEKYFFSLSPATIRWGMLELTEQAYLRQPHISAGRIPTDKGYRLFVEELMEERSLSEKEKIKIKSDLAELKVGQQHFNRKLVECLAAMSQQLSINKENDDIYEAGLRWLIREPEFADRDSIVNLINSVDSLKQLEDLFGRTEDEIQVFIGERDLGPRLKNCSLITQTVRLPRGESHVIGFLGPRRMDYAKNISLLDFASKILDDF